MSRATAIGIDLGTTRSRVAVFRNGCLQNIQCQHGLQYMPNVVGYARIEPKYSVCASPHTFISERVVGQYAAALVEAKNGDNKMFNIKRLMGRPCGDRWIASDSTTRPFKVMSRQDYLNSLYPGKYPAKWSHLDFKFDDGRREKPTIALRSHKGIRTQYYAEEISAMLLQKMKEAAEIYLGMPVTDAVISVPACFNDAQRQATLDAATLAGLNVLRLINDPTAVAIHYSYYLEKVPSAPREVLIIDLGGGSCDVSKFTVNDNEIVMTSSFGDSHLGGEDFVNTLMEHVIEKIDKGEHSPRKVSNSPGDMDSLRRCCEKAMHELSTRDMTDLNFVKMDPHAGKNPGYQEEPKLTRARFEELNAPLLNRLSTLLSETKTCVKGDLNDVILVGGASVIPKVQQMIRDTFKVKEFFTNFSNPEMAIAFGAAIMAAKLQGDQTTGAPEVFEFFPRSLSYQFSGGNIEPLVNRNQTRIPLTTFIQYPLRSGETDPHVNVYEIGETSEKSEKKKKSKDPKEEERNLLGKFGLAGISEESVLRTTQDSSFVHNNDVIIRIDLNGILDVRCGEQFQVFPYKDGFRASEIEALKQHAEEYPSKQEKAEIRKREVDSINTKIAEYMVCECDINLSVGNKETIRSTCEETRTWLEANMENDRTDQFKEKLWQLKAACQPIADKLKKLKG